jgi:hypothetical protein
MAQEIVARIPAVAAAGNLDSVIRLLSQSFDERLLRRFDRDDDARDLLVFTLVWISLEKRSEKYTDPTGLPSQNCSLNSRLSLKL